MPNPEQGPPGQEFTGNWVTVDIELPDIFEDARDAVDQIATLLINLLQVISNILEIVKGLAVGFVDPISAIIEALIALIEALINDLRQTGLYMHGDWYILEGPEFRNVLGGFSAYERRMIARLVDKRDPNRPNFTSGSLVLSIFLYTSADISQVLRLVNFLRAILRFLNQAKIPNARPLPGITNVQALYGFEGATVFSRSLFEAVAKSAKSLAKPGGDITPPDTVNLTWQTAAAPGNFFSPLQVYPPPGFLVEVSTEPGALLLNYEVTAPGSRQVTAGNKGSEPEPKRQKGLCTDEYGTTIRLTGGADQVELVGGDFYNDAVSLANPFTGAVEKLKSGEPRVFAYRSTADAVPIPLELLKDNDIHYLQKTFYVPQAQSVFFPGKGYGYSIKREDMPHAATFTTNPWGEVEVTDEGIPDTFYVRVRAVSPRIEDTDDFRYVIDYETLNKGAPVFLRNAKSGKGENIGPEDRGEASTPLVITFPNANTLAYLDTLTTALIVMVLSRADLELVLDDDGNPLVISANDPTSFLARGLTNWEDRNNRAAIPTGLEEFATTLMPQLTGKRDTAKFFSQTGVPGDTFRNKLLTRARNLANRLYRDFNPAPSIQSLVVNEASALLDFKFSDFESPGAGHGVSSNPYPEWTILETMEGGNRSTELNWFDEIGIALNRESVDLPELETDLANLRADKQAGTTTKLVRPPMFFERSLGTIVAGSADDCPVIYRRASALAPSFEAIDFLRNIFYEGGGDIAQGDIYAAAALTLNVATGPFVRPFEKGWKAIRFFPGGLPDLDNFLEEILAFLRSIAAAIQSIIDFIVSIIEFIQSRILELQALIARINALIQSILRIFDIIPSSSGLVLVSKGTDGVLTGLISAGDKPYDGAQYYGAGVVLLAGGLPVIAVEILQAFFKSG